MNDDLTPWVVDVPVAWARSGLHEGFIDNIVEKMSDSGYRDERNKLAALVASARLTWNEREVKEMIAEMIAERMIKAINEKEDAKQQEGEGRERQRARPSGFCGLFASHGR